MTMPTWDGSAGSKVAATLSQPPISPGCSTSAKRISCGLVGDQNPRPSSVKNSVIHDASSAPLGFSVCTRSIQACEARILSHDVWRTFGPHAGWRSPARAGDAPPPGSNWARVNRSDAKATISVPSAGPD